MLLSKFKTALLTSILTWLFCVVLMPIVGIFLKVSGRVEDISVAIGGSFLLIIYIVPVIILIGIPISVAADQLTKESSYRKMYAFLIHNGLGVLLFYFVFSNEINSITFDYIISASPWLIIVITSASLFWKFDEKAKSRLV